MARLSQMRAGIELKAYRRTVPFSYWPTAPTQPRPTIQSLLFALDPWVMMRRAIVDQVNNEGARDEALSYVEQAEDYFVSAQNSGIGAAKPVQLYYSYLNIAKAFIICRGSQQSLPRIWHGISETLPQGGEEFVDANLQYWRSPNAQNGKLNAFDEFAQALGTKRPLNGHQIPVPAVVPQVLSGHRIWAMAAEEKERFIAVERIQFTESKSRKLAWLRLYLFSDDLRRLGYTQADLLEKSRLHGDFRKVRCSEEKDGRSLLCFEQRDTLAHNRHGVDLAMDLVQIIRPNLWTTVGSSPPYRRYYLYLGPTNEQASVLDQLLSIYALTFYLGSLTRYRPTAYQTLLDGKFGPRISEFISGQPSQFVYLMASEFQRRDVTRPSIV